VSGASDQGGFLRDNTLTVPYLTYVNCKRVSWPLSRNEELTAAVREPFLFRPPPGACVWNQLVRAQVAASQQFHRICEQRGGTVGRASLRNP